MSKSLKQKIRSAFATGICVIMCASTCLMAVPQNALAATASGNYLDANGVHVYRDTPGDVESTKYDVQVNGTDVKTIKYDQNGNNFDIARFATGTMSPEITVTIPNEEINTVKVYPERYYDASELKVSEDKHTLTFTMDEDSNLRYAFVMINGGPSDQKGKPYLALINDPEENVPDMTGENVLNFKTFSEEYLAAHPNSEAETAEEAGTTSGGVAYAAGQLVDNNTAQVRFPNKRKMLDNDVTYALQAALDEIYKEGSKYDTLYFPDGTYICSGLEIRNRNGKHVNIYMDEGALVKNRLQECMQAMEPAIGIWDSSDITISGRGMFDGSGVANYSKDRHDAKDSCHQGGVMIVRSSNIVFNDTYVRDAKQWNWESHGSKNCTLNNIKGLTPYNQPWVDGLDMASAQDLTINGALTMGNDDNFASGHYNPSDGFTASVPGFDQYNSDALAWDTEDSFNVNVSNTLGWSYAGGNGIRMGHNVYGHQMKNYTFDNVNTSNFQGGGRGVTVQNNTGTYPRYESIVIKNSSFDTTRVGTNLDVNGRADNMIDTVIIDNCWFSNANDGSKFNNIKNLTITNMYMGGKKVTVSNFAKVTTNNVTNFIYDWADNHAPEFTAPSESSYNAKVGEAIQFTVAATDADQEEVTLSAANLPEGAAFDAATGKFTWTPSEAQLGSTKVTFTATDAKGVATVKWITFAIKGKDETEVSRTSVKEDAFVGSWSGDQSKNYGSANFLRTSYSNGSNGVLGTTSGSDNKVTYLKFDVSSIDLTQVDRVKLQMTLLGVRYNDAKNLDAQILVGMAEDNSWTESELTWKNKPAVTTSETDLAASETFNLGEVVSNDPAQISTPNGTNALVDVTAFVEAAKEAGSQYLTLAVNIDGSNGIDKANRIYFVSKEGAQKYANAAEMVPILIATKYEEPEHVHTLVKTDAKAATCTEDGNKAYYTCSGCGKVFADEAATEEIALEETVIKATGHNWDAGVITKEPTTEEEGIRTYTCQNCGETRTEKIDKLEPTPDPKPTHADGLANEMAEDGNWYVYRDNAVDYTYTGLAANNNGWFMVVNGAVDFGYTGLAANEYGWFMVVNGAVDFGYTGLAANNNGWFMVVNGVVDFGYTGLAANEYGWFMVINGAVDFSYTGLAANEYGWFMVVNGAINFNYNGLVQNEYGWWKVTAGKVDFSYSGFAINEYGTWYVRGGKVDFSYHM